MIDHAKLYGTTPVRVLTRQFVVLITAKKIWMTSVILNYPIFLQFRTSLMRRILVMLMININAGHNKELLETCKTLGDDATDVARVRKYVKEMPIASAVDLAISECIEEDVLADLRSKNRAEAKKMSIYEYDEEAVKKVWQDEAFSEGRQEGVAQGRSL